jgi:hypothetical protein
MTREWRKILIKERHNFYPLVSSIVTAKRCIRRGWARHVAHMQEVGNLTKVTVSKSKRNLITEATLYGV